MENRRIHPRVSVEAEVWLGEDGVFTHGRERITNLSVGGAFIEAKTGYALGSVVSIRFLLGSHYITSTTVVRNAVPGGWIEVDFIDVSRENEERLAAFIANLE